jgi:hypothetical protein
LAKARSWTAREELQLRRLYPASSPAKLSSVFGRSPRAIATRAKVLGVHKALGHGGRYPWSKKDDKLLRQTYPYLSTKEIAEVIGCSKLAAYQRASVLGLRKSPAYVTETNKALGHALASSGASHRYPKGHVPANKGTRRPGWSPGRMKETQFKKGQRAGAAQAKWLPIGTVKMNGDGYLRRKIADEPEAIAGKGGTSTNWEFVHRRVWEDVHGPIPDGYRIWWKDGNHENCALENLELLSGAEHMARTTIQNLSPALKQVIQLTGALKRKIRNREGKLNGKEHVAGSEGSSVCPTGSAERQREAGGA